MPGKIQTSGRAELYAVLQVAKRIIGNAVVYTDHMPTQKCFEEGVHLQNRAS